MNILSRIIGRYSRKTILITLAALLLGLNFFRVAGGYYDEQLENLKSKNAQLEKHRITTRKLPELRQQVAVLEERQKQIEEYLFVGSSEEEVASAIQIMLQEKLSGAGLETESLHPIKQGLGKGDGQEREYGEILIKARLSGSLNAFVDFIAELYKSKQLFKVESFSMKSYRGTGLKIFFEFKGYYKIAS